MLSETEIWPFLRLLRMNSSEMQYRVQLNWTKELNYAANIIGLIL